MSEPSWLTSEHLEQINERVVAEKEEPFGILKRHELESAPMRPRQLYYLEYENDIAILAVRLMMAVVWAHPFIQGNKRTGFIAADIFLDQNGWLLDIPDWTDIADEIIAAADDPSKEEGLVDLFRENLIELA